MYTVMLLAREVATDSGTVMLLAREKAIDSSTVMLLARARELGYRLEHSHVVG